jgi:hypothetical protein
MSARKEQTNVGRVNSTSKPKGAQPPRTVDEILAWADDAEPEDGASPPDNTLHGFTMSPDPKDRVGLYLAYEIRYGITWVDKAEQVGLSQVFCYAAYHGLGAYVGWPEVQTIINAYADVLKGGGDLQPFDAWRFKPEWRELKKQSFYGVHERVTKRCARLQRVLGRESAVLYSIGVCLGLKGLRLPDHIADQLTQYLDEERTALGPRARRLAKHAGHVQVATTRIFEP